MSLIDWFNFECFWRSEEKPLQSSSNKKLRLENKKVEYIDSWFLQTSAYSLAHNIVYNTNITSCVILVCTVDNLFQEFKIQGSELITYQNLFLGRLKKFNELSNLI